MIPSQGGAHKKRMFELLCVTVVDFITFVMVNDLSLKDILSLVVFILLDFYVSFRSCFN